MSNPSGRFSEWVALALSAREVRSTVTANSIRKVPLRSRTVETTALSPLVHLEIVATVFYLHHIYFASQMQYAVLEGIDCKTTDKY